MLMLMTQKYTTFVRSLYRQKLVLINNKYASEQIIKLYLEERIVLQTARLVAEASRAHHHIERN